MKNPEDFDYLVVGCGLTGSVVARELAERGKRVLIWERRDHIGGNMYSYVEEHGFLVHKYGPHTFHTKKPELYAYMCRYEQWQAFESTAGAVLNGTYTPTPFNFTTIDTFYAPEDAARLKEKLLRAFPGRDKAPVLEVLRHEDPDIRAYAEFLFKNDYAPYTAKQWGISPEEIDPSVLGRLPLRFSYSQKCFDDAYQAMPVHSYTRFFERLLDHPNIHVELGVEALKSLAVQGNELFISGKRARVPVVYTGALDELFGCTMGRLPYRSLRFEWKYSAADSFQPAVLVAYPQAEGFTRIVEYKKFPEQPLPGTCYAVEYPVAYQDGKGAEPYYPILTQESQRLYARYRQMADATANLICCGRLADFKYYDMDQALERALEVAERLGKGLMEEHKEQRMD